MNFPISVNPADNGYINKINRFANRAIPASAIDEIKRVQPHNAGYEPLGWLHELVNADKHRSPVLTITHLPVFVWVGNEPTTTTGLFQDMGANLDAGTRTVTGRVSGLAMDMEYQGTIQVTFTNLAVPREPIDLLLQQIVKTVADIVPRFDSFF